MLRALGVVLAASASIGWAQFSGLATPHDGSKVYFSSSLRLKGTAQPHYNKLFVADESGVHLFRVLPKGSIQSSGDTCVLDNQYTIDSTQVSADGSTVAGIGRRWFAGKCNPNSLYSTDLITAGGERQIGGRLTLSPGGRYAVVDTPPTDPPYLESVAVLDLQTGVSTAIPLPAQTCYFGVPRTRPISNNGTVIIDCTLSGAGGFSVGYVAKLGEAAQPFPIPGGIPWEISADGSKVLYRKGKGTGAEYRLLDLNTQHDQSVVANPFEVMMMSDDGGRVLLWSDRPYIIQSDGTGLKPLTANPVAFTPEVVLSGDGRIAYLPSPAGELLKIQVDTAEATKLIGRTPYVDTVGYGTAGWVTTIGARNLTSGIVDAPPPLPVSLEKVTVHIDLPDRSGHGNGAVRKIFLPIEHVAVSDLRFLLPWNLEPLRIDPRHPVPITVDVEGVDTPFDSPEVQVYIRSGFSATGLNVIPHRSDQIQVLAIGLGDVYPEVPEGFQAPSAEPFSRLVQPLSCNDGRPSPQTIPVLYAGLQPGSVSRIYQVTMQAPAIGGYYLIKCSLGGGPYFDFIQIEVVP